MKTSFDIDDSLLQRARLRARRDNTTLKQLIESGLRLALKEPPTRAGSSTFIWPVAVNSLTKPLNGMSVNQAIDALRDAVDRP
jgi:hypothetical protein